MFGWPTETLLFVACLVICFNAMCSFVPWLVRKLFIAGRISARWGRIFKVDRPDGSFQLLKLVSIGEDDASVKVCPRCKASYHE